MIRKSLLLLAVIGLFAGACNNNKTVSRVHKFKNGVWERFEFLSFELPVNDTKTTYDIIIDLRFTAEFPAESLYVNVVMTTPSGEERIKDYNMTLKDGDGDFLGKKTDGIYQLSVPIRRGIRFSETGVCKFEIENLMPKYVTSGIVDFGITMEEKEK